METQAWRIPYLEEKIHEQFRTHIYGWVSRAPGGGFLIPNTTPPETNFFACVDSNRLGKIRRWTSRN